MTPLQQAAWNKSIRDSVDELLQKNGYNADASARHQLSMMNFEAEQAQAVEPVAWVFLPNRELLWPSEVEATNPIAIDEYKPLYAHPAPPVQQVAVPATDGEIYTAYITATNQTLRPQDAPAWARKFARAIEAHHKIGAKP